MNHFWIRNKKNKLLVFFNGWGCDEYSFSHLHAKDYDLLLLNDYKELILKESLILEIKNYPEIYVVGWSYGVWVANYIWSISQLPVNKAIAINGTTLPMHDQYGIPKSLTLGTLNHLSESSLLKFQWRMVGGSQYWKHFVKNKPQRKLADQKEELRALIQHFKKHACKEGFYSFALIGSKDLVFSVDNQRKFWKGKVPIKEIEAPHFCFYIFKDWDELLAL